MLLVEAKKRKRWTDTMIEAELREFSDTLGRMPSGNEIQATGRNDLAAAISRGVGYKAWADKLNLKQKGTETHLALKWQEKEATYFRSLDLVVTAKSARAPYDLLVGSKRVDVKVAHYRSYPINNNTSACSGFFFAGLKMGKTCDIFDLVCLEEDRVLQRFIIPSEHAQVQTVTISPKTLTGETKYSRFKDNLSPLSL